MAKNRKRPSKPDAMEWIAAALELTVTNPAFWTAHLREELDEAFLIAQHPYAPLFRFKNGYRFSLVDDEPPEPPFKPPLDVRVEVPAAQPSKEDRDDARTLKQLSPSKRLTLTVEEAAETLGISRALAYEAVRRGEIPNIRIGKRILVPKAALDRLLAAASRAVVE